MKNSIVCNSVDKIMHAQQAQERGNQSDTGVYISKHFCDVTKPVYHTEKAKRSMVNWQVDVSDFGAAEHGAVHFHVRKVGHWATAVTTAGGYFSRLVKSKESWFTIHKFVSLHDKTTEAKPEMCLLWETFRWIVWWKMYLILLPNGIMSLHENGEVGDLLVSHWPIICTSALSKGCRLWLTITFG